MKKPHLAKTWRIAAVVLPAAAVLYICFNFLLFPRFESWILSQIPGSAAVKKTLQAEFPKDKILISSNTNYNSGCNGKQRTLTVGVLGNSFLSAGESAKAKDLICSALGQNAQKYNTIRLRSTVAHQFVFFYSMQSQYHDVRCS